jgi:O-phosphoseryl-tRNA(Cys) synthetase
MSLPDKKLERLNQLLSAFDDGAIQPDELNQALEAVMTVIESANRE